MRIRVQAIVMVLAFACLGSNSSSATERDSPCEAAPAAAVSAPGEASAPLRQIEQTHVTQPELDRLLNGADRRVRGLTAALENLIRDTARRSPTFARMLKALEETDVIVQLVEEWQLPPPMLARTLFAGLGGDFRILRIQMGRGGAGIDRAALLGHELFHALEIGSDSTVRDDAAVFELYRRIGFVTPGETRVDSAAAGHVGRQIAREIWARC